MDTTQTAIVDEYARATSALVTCPAGDRAAAAEARYDAARAAAHKLAADRAALLAHLRALVDGIAAGVAIPRDGAAINAARAAIAAAEQE